jgi:hypothetical protein
VSVFTRGFWARILTRGFWPVSYSFDASKAFEQYVATVTADDYIMNTDGPDDYVATVDVEDA